MKKTYIEILALILLCSCGQASAQKSNDGAQAFEKVTLSSTFYGEGVEIGNINQDDHPDVVAGPFWYEGPDFKKKHAYYKPEKFDPRHYSDNFIIGIDDVNEDGRNDILVVGFPGEEAFWYENPQNSEGAWKQHLIHSKVDNESPAFYDLTGNGKLDLIFHTDGYLGYASPGSDEPTKPWSFHEVSKQHDWGKFTHGLGLGDINGDGRQDILKKNGWWENPGKDSLDTRWTYHQADFGPGGAQMYAYDVDSDGHNDVLTTLDAHGWGLAWFRQIPEEEDITFERNLIMGESLSDNPYGVRFSQPHVLELVDMDNDGVKDLVSGKRFWAHGPLGGFEPNAPAVVYWFKLKKGDKGYSHFVPYLVDDNSGVGVEIATGDLDGDGYPDIATSNKNGTFVFFNRLQNKE